MKKIIPVFLCAAAIAVYGCSRNKIPVSPAEYTPTYTVTRTMTPAYTATNTATGTASPSVTATRTATATATPSLTNTPVFSHTDTATASNTRTATRTATATPSYTATKTATATFTDTPFFTSTTTPTCTETATINPASPTVNITPPASTVRMISIHHSTGYNWLENGYGNLGQALNANNYYVNEAYYGWLPAAVPSGCPSNLGDNTDTIHWPCWFNDTVMPSVYNNDSYYAYTSNTMADPGGENEIIMFKSCFPNSEVGSDITDEQAIYNGLLAYFSVHTDKMFVLIIPPPMQYISDPAATRQLSNWLADRVNGWLSGYAAGNVFAFDYYNVLTHADNHHYVLNGYEQHVAANSQNTLYYPSADDHPSVTGQQKATAEFVPLLNAWWNKWKGN